MKKLWIVLFLLTIIVVVVSFLLQKKSTPELETINYPSSAPTISAPAKFGSLQANVIFSYAGASITFPSSLPSYSLSYPFDLVLRTTDLANSWEIPLSNTKTVSYVHDWIGNQQILTYNENAKSISYSFSSSQSDASNIKLLNSVLSSLADYNFISSSFSLKEKARTSISNEEGEGTTSDPSNISIVYDALIKNTQYSAIFSPLSPSAGDISINKNGGVLSFSFFVQPTLSPKENSPLLPISTAISELNAGKGYLAELDKDFVLYSQQPDPVFSKVSIMGISIGYLLDSNSFSLVPIYIFDGYGYGEKTQQVRFYLRATN